MSSPTPKGWEEKFQDLSGWCSPTSTMIEQKCIADPAELNTPVIELGCDELQLNFNASKAEIKSIQDVDESIVKFWPSVEESTFRDMWLLETIEPEDSETYDKNEAKVNNLLGPTNVDSLIECNSIYGIAPDLAMKTDVVTHKEQKKVLTSKPKLKLNIPGCVSFNHELSTPEIVSMLVESPEPVAGIVRKSFGCAPMEANSLDEPDDLQPFVQEQSEEFDLLAYVFEDTSKSIVSGLNERKEARSKAVKSSLPRPRGKPSISQIIKEDKLCFSKQNHGGSPPHLPLPVSTDVKKEETSDEDESNSKRKQSKKRKFNTESLKAREGPAKRVHRSTSSTSTLSETPLDIKYRELRDRNNEASKRSRYNRKIRDGEMSKEALRLEKENHSLKIKAEEMERLVKQLRESLLKMIGGRK